MSMQVFFNLLNEAKLATNRMFADKFQIFFWSLFIILFCIINFYLNLVLYFIYYIYEKAC